MTDDLVGSIRRLGKVPVPLPGNRLSSKFLRALGAPEMLSKLTLTISAGGFLEAEAVYYTGGPYAETAIMKWRPELDQDGVLYRVLTGELQ